MTTQITSTRVKNTLQGAKDAGLSVSKLVVTEEGRIEISFSDDEKIEESGEGLGPVNWGEK